MPAAAIEASAKHIIAGRGNRSLSKAYYCPPQLRSKTHQSILLPGAAIEASAKHVITGAAIGASAKHIIAGRNCDRSFSKAYYCRPQLRSKPQQSILLPAAAIGASARHIIARRGNRSFGKGYCCPPWQSKLPQKPLLLVEAIAVSPRDIIAQASIATALNPDSRAEMNRYFKHERL
jgi:hypothetical protein